MLLSLIGFWFHRPAAARPPRSLFSNARGDVGFLAAILVLYAYADPLYRRTPRPGRGWSQSAHRPFSWAAIGLFLVPWQVRLFPLHSGCPDAMKVPTPVPPSSMPHHGGRRRHLVARLYPVLSGAGGAPRHRRRRRLQRLFAAVLAMVRNDIKGCWPNPIPSWGYDGGPGHMAALSWASLPLLTRLLQGAALSGAGSLSHAVGILTCERWAACEAQPWILRHLHHRLAQPGRRLAMSGSSARKRFCSALESNPNYSPVCS